MRQRRKNGQCWPWAHEWTAWRSVTIPLFSTDRGLIRNCNLCPKVDVK